MRSMWLKCEAKNNETGEWAEEEFVRSLKYATPRVEEVEAYGPSVAEWFGKFEADRTGKMGVKRPPIDERDEAEYEPSLKRAKLAHAAATAKGLIKNSD